jgi:periplasmic protein TonB
LNELHKEQPQYNDAGLRPRRHLASFAASIAAHAAIVGLIVCFASPVARTHSEWVLAYLVEVGDSAGSAGRGGASAAVSGTAPSIRAVSANRATPAARLRRRIARPATEVASLMPTRPVAPSRPGDSPRAPAAALGGAASARAAVGIDSSGSGNGTGAGAGGAGDDPNSAAHADYARNPPPAYPAVARRRAQQGTVTVRVLVGVDGSVERAEIADSSGFDTLDDAALETVRSRWRFVPARRDGVAVESWVLVPIRFALVEANASR